MKSIIAWLFAASVVQAADDTPTRIAFSVHDGKRSGIYIVNSDGSEQRRLTKNRTDLLPRWSPDGKQIAFLSLEEQDFELNAEHDLAFHWFLYVMDADGQNQRRVTKTPIGMIFHWSPDGSRFVFQSSYEDGKNKGKDGTVSSAIYVMKANGTQQKRLTPIDGHDGFPTWSPDSMQISFCSNRDGNMDIFVVKADGSATKRLTDDAAGDANPIWSPDGKQIAFTSYRKRDGGSVYVANADGTRESWLSVSGSPVCWSSGGGKVLVTENGQIAAVDADGQQQTSLTEADSRALDAVFSSDGNTMFYRTKGSDGWEIRSVSVNGANRKRIIGDVRAISGFSVCPNQR